ncbi:hypothetical protein HY404_03780 [Candidatus Microgenomates bacterium]|nr:hypothetical protein [Candidatus Microgenomates bacterium]
MIRKIINLALGLLGCLALGLFLVSPSFGQESASPPGKTIRDNLKEKVEEKLNQLAKKPRSYVGKINQITDGVVMLDAKSGLKQIKITSSTTIIEVGKGGRKTIKSTDLVVGNFAVVMGYLESKDTLNASRILTMSENPERVRRPVYGVVQTIVDKTITVKHPKAESSPSGKDEIWTVKTSAKTKVTKKVDNKMTSAQVADIAVGDRIIAIGEPVKDSVNTITAKLIHVIPGKATGLIKSPSPSPKPTKKPTPSPTATPAE